MTATSVTMNRHAIVDLALFGPADKIEAVFRQLYPTMKKLRLLRFVDKAQAFVEPPDGLGSWPQLHDTMRWLDSLTRNAEHKDDRLFLLRLYKTLLSRVRPEVIEDLQKGGGH